MSILYSDFVIVAGAQAGAQPAIPLEQYDHPGTIGFFRKELALPDGHPAFLNDYRLGERAFDSAQGRGAHDFVHRIRRVNSWIATTGGHSKSRRFKKGGHDAGTDQ